MDVNKECELLNFLLENIKGKSRNNIKSLLKYSQIYVNGKPITQFNYLLNVGDVVTVGEFRSDEELAILYEDEYILAINKPANILSVRNNLGDYSAISMIEKYFKKSNRKQDIFVVHRLDKATSGVYIIAKSYKIQQTLQDDWNNIVQYRGYLAIVSGKITADGRVESFLEEDKNNVVRSTQTGGKHAITNYKVLKFNEEYTYLQVNIETGRKNQIRAHFSELGHPIVGDFKYGSESRVLKRLGLHAYKLVFVHPITKKKVTIEAPTPTEFIKFSKRM